MNALCPPYGGHSSRSNCAQVSLRGSSDLPRHSAPLRAHPRSPRGLPAARQGHGLPPTARSAPGVPQTWPPRVRAPCTCLSPGLSTERHSPQRALGQSNAVQAPGDTLPPSGPCPWRKGCGTRKPRGPRRPGRGQVTGGGGRKKHLGKSLLQAGAAGGAESLARSSTGAQGNAGSQHRAGAAASASRCAGTCARRADTLRARRAGVWAAVRRHRRQGPD